MKNFESQQFRDNLAKEIKEAPKEGRKEILDRAKETPEYQKARTGKIKERQGEEEKLDQLRQGTGVEIEIISGVPVFTIETGQKDEVISKITQFFGENTVFRIINAQFVDDAIEFGTDKGRVDEHDFRRVADGAGYDVWGVEKQALKQGLKKSDVFCGTPYKMFAKGGSEFSSGGLGIPDDRAAILIYDGGKLQEVEGPEEMGGLSDGYVFKDTKTKREALLGIMKFRESFTEFERELHALESADDKVALLEKEVFQNLNNKDDLKNAPYIALNIIAILHQESLKNTKNPSADSTERIGKLKIISDRLEYEIRMIDFADNMSGQVKMTREAFSKNDNRRMELMRTWPDFVIETTENYLQENEVDEKYKRVLLEIIEEARKCKLELNL